MPRVRLRVQHSQPRVDGLTGWVQAVGKTAIDCYSPIRPLRSFRELRNHIYEFGCTHHPRTDAFSIELLRQTNSYRRNSLCPSNVIIRDHSALNRFQLGFRQVVRADGD